jgi:hypothetical protein
MSRSNELPPQEDDLLDSLPAHDVAPERAERIRRHAHVLLREGRQRVKQAEASGWALSYHRFVEPAVLIGLGLWQLAWTVQDTVALFH